MQTGRLPTIKMEKQDHTSHNDSSVASEDIRAALNKWVDMLDQSFSTNWVHGLTTGWEDVDFMLGGLRSGEVVVVSGHPQSGRRAFLYGVVKNVCLARENPSPAAIVAVAQEATWVVERLISTICCIDRHRLRRAEIDDSEWPKITAAVDVLVNSPVYFFLPPRATISRLRRQLTELKRTNPELAIVMVERLPLLEPESHSEYSPSYFERLMRELKTIAAELKIVLIAGTDLCNQRYFERPNKRAVLTDFNPNHAIHLFADRVILLYREDYFYEESPDARTIEVMIAKNDFGPVGTVRLNYVSECDICENYVYEADENSI